MLELHGKHYMGEGMALVVLAGASLDGIEWLVREHFSAIPARCPLQRYDPHPIAQRWCPPPGLLPTWHSWQRAPPGPGPIFHENVHGDTKKSVPQRTPGVQKARVFFQ